MTSQTDNLISPTISLALPTIANLGEIADSVIWGNKCVTFFILENQGSYQSLLKLYEKKKKLKSELEGTLNKLNAGQVEYQNQQLFS